jgi:hypothetical protein
MVSVKSSVLQSWSFLRNPRRSDTFTFTEKARFIVLLRAVEINPTFLCAYLRQTLEENDQMGVVAIQWMGVS